MPRMQSALLSLLGLAVLSPLTAQRTTARAVEDILPASSYACVRFGGLADCGSVTQGMPMTALVQGILGKMPEATKQEHLTSGLDMAAHQVRKHLEEVGIRPATLRAVLQRPMALGIGRLTIHGYGPSVALVIDTGDARRDLEELLTAVEGMIKQFDPRTQIASERIAGLPVRTIQVDEAPKVLMANVGEHFVLTNSEGYLAEMAEVAAGKKQSLAQASSLGAVRKHLPMPALASGFLNVRPFMTMLDPVLPYEAATYGKLLGWTGCDGLFWGTSGGKDGATDVLHLGMTGPEQGLLKAAFKGPVSLGAARYCSPEAVAFAAGSLDLPAVVDAFDAFLSALPAEIQKDMRREMQRELSRELRRELGMTPEQLDALIRAFGNNFAFAVDLQKGPMPLPEVLMFVEVADLRQVAPLIARLEQQIAAETGVEWKVRKSGDSEIRYCNVNVGVALSPCWTWHDGMVIVSSHVKTLTSALNRVAKGEDSLASTNDFRDAAQNCGTASALVHLRFEPAARIGWSAAEGMLRAMVDQNEEMLGFSGEVVPDAEQVGRALGYETSSLHVDDTGVWMKKRGSLAFGSVMAALGALTDEVLDRASAKVF